MKKTFAYAVALAMTIISIYSCSNIEIATFEAKLHDFVVKSVHYCFPAEFIVILDSVGNGHIAVFGNLSRLLVAVFESSNLDIAARIY